MVPYYTTDELIEAVKRRISIPENQPTFTEDDFLAFANEEMSLNVVPSILSLHEDHFIYQEVVPLEANKSAYRIPTRAIGNKLRDVQYLDENGNLREMSRIKIGDIPDYQGVYVQNNPYLYYVEYNRVHLLPHIGDSVTGSLVFYYYIRPNQMVSEDRVGIITDINRTTGEIFVDTIPSHFSTDIEYDLYMVGSPHRHLAINISAPTVNSTTGAITFDVDDIPDELEVGDHIAQAEECKIPQIPSDLHVLLSQYIAERILESQGDNEGLQQSRIKTAQMEMKAGNIIDNRVDDAPIKIVNRHSPLRTGTQKNYYRRGK